MRSCIEVSGWLHLCHASWPTQQRPAQKRLTGTAGRQASTYVLDIVCNAAVNTPMWQVLTQLACGAAQQSRKPASAPNHPCADPLLLRVLLRVCLLPHPRYPGSQGKQYFLGLEAVLGGSGDPAYPGVQG